MYDGSSQSTQKRRSWLCPSPAHFMSNLFLSIGTSLSGIILGCVQVIKSLAILFLPGLYLSGNRITTKSLHSNQPAMNIQQTFLNISHL